MTVKQFLTCFFTPLTAPGTTSEDLGILASCKRIELNRIVVNTPLPIFDEPNPDVACTKTETEQTELRSGQVVENVQ